MHGGANLPIVGSYNRSLVLAAVRLQPSISRVELATQSGLTTQTVSNIVRRLLDDGLIVESGQGASTGGKPRTLLTLNARSRFSVGIQVDPHDIVYVVTDLCGTVVARSHVPSRGAATTVEELATGVRLVIAAADVPVDRIVGVGLAVPGPIDDVAGIVVAPPNMLEWHGLRLREALERATGYDVTVDNDANAAAIGLQWAGETGTSRNFACLYFGTGIGAGLFVDGHIYRGSTHNAGEWGHLTVHADGPECRCGNRGCLELYATPAAVVAFARQSNAAQSGGRPRARGGLAADGLERVTDYETLSRAGRDGDATIDAALDRAAHHVAAATVTLINVLDMDLLMLCGPAVPHVGERFADAIRHEITSRALARVRQHVQVRVSPIGADAGALGAASLPLFQVFAPRLAGLGEADRVPPPREPAPAAVGN